MSMCCWKYQFVSKSFKYLYVYRNLKFSAIETENTIELLKSMLKLNSSVFLSFKYLVVFFAKNNKLFWVKKKCYNVDFRCHPWKGTCECVAGWDGPTCSRTCPLYTYGERCRRKCDCHNNAQCLANNGTCICGPGMQLSQ